MAQMLRTTTTRHPATPNVEHRVALHQPYAMDDDSKQLVANGDPWIVIELFHRNEAGDWTLIGSMREEAYREQVRDVADIVKQMKPEKKTKAK